jgi:hypothetical protein
MIRKYPDIIIGMKTAHYWTGKPWAASKSVGRNASG